MLHKPLNRRLVLFIALVACPALCSTAEARSPDDRGVITIYNRTPIHLNYQLRVKRRDSSEWDPWQRYVHKYPRGGHRWHWFPRAEAIQIRFDRIGGDDEFTEKVYDLKFRNFYGGGKPCRHKGRPYKFEFDAGGRLLDLYTARHSW